MARAHRNFHKWHIWLGWLIGVPLILWTASGLFMVARPIEEVRGNHLRIPEKITPLSTLTIVPIEIDPDSVNSATLLISGLRTVWHLEKTDGSIERYDAVSGSMMPWISKDEAMEIVSNQVRGGDKILFINKYDDGLTVSDFRRPQPVWQVILSDKTHVYVDQRTGEIAAIRTQFWRAFDFMWGLHIMDLQTREDTSHPILIGSAALALFGSILGFIMLFSRRKKRFKAAA